MVLSNLCSPEKFPEQFGSLDDAISLIISFTTTPDEPELMPVLDLLAALIRREWACKALLANSSAIKFLLTRKQLSQEASTLKFSLVTYIVSECPWRETLDPVLMS